MAAGAVGTCWKQTPAWSTTAWVANSWAGAGTSTVTTASNRRGQGFAGGPNTVLPAVGASWTARGKTRFEDGKPVVTKRRIPKEHAPVIPVARAPVVEAPKPPPRLRSFPTPVQEPAPVVETAAEVLDLPFYRAKGEAYAEKKRREADDAAAIDALLKVFDAD